MIELAEHSLSDETALDDSDVAYVLARHGKHVTLEPSGRKWRLRSGSHVGLIQLPSGLQINIRPKVRVANLLYMISYTHNLVDFRYLDARQIDKNDSILEVYAIVLLNWIETLFKKGLYRSYLAKHESLVGLRGKVILPLNMRPSPRLWCEYDELSYATIENRLIKGALFFLLQLPLSSKTHQRALSYVRLLGDVDALALRKENLTVVRYHRLNEHYRIILELCALLSNQTVLRDEAGKRFFSGYMMDMDMVFQYFMLRVLQKWLAEEGVSSGRKSAWAQALQSDSYLPVIEPDIVIRNRLVIDTKYYKGPLNANNKYHSDNLAQIHLYMQAYGLNGILVYPQMDAAFDHTYRFEGFEFTVLTFPLDVDSSQLEKAIEYFVRTVVTHFGTEAA